MQSNKEKNRGNNRHREKKPRDTRGAVRTKVPISGEQAGIRGDESHGTMRADRRSQGHGTRSSRKTQRSNPELGHGVDSHNGRNHSLASHDLRGKITEDQANRMLERMAREQFLDNPNAIFRMGEDVHAFGRYLIHRSRDGYQIFRGATLAAETGSSRVAISWCIADKLNKHELTQEIIWADQAVEWRTKEIENYRHTLDISQDQAKKYIVADRLADAQIKLKSAQERLDKCLNLAKYWQHKGFNNETARTGIKN